MRGIVLATCTMIAFTLALVLPAFADLEAEVGFGPRSINTKSKGNFVSVEFSVYDPDVLDRLLKGNGVEWNLTTKDIDDDGGWVGDIPDIEDEYWEDTDLVPGVDTYVVKYLRSEWVTEAGSGTNTVEVEGEGDIIGNGTVDFDKDFDFLVFTPPRGGP